MSEPSSTVHRRPYWRLLLELGLPVLLLVVSPFVSEEKLLRVICFLAGLSLLIRAVSRLRGFSARDEGLCVDWVVTRHTVPWNQVIGLSEHENGSWSVLLTGGGSYHLPSGLGGLENLVTEIRSRIDGDHRVEKASRDVRKEFASTRVLVYVLSILIGPAGVAFVLLGNWLSLAELLRWLGPAIAVAGFGGVYYLLSRCPNCNAFVWLRSKTCRNCEATLQD